MEVPLPVRPDGSSGVGRGRHNLLKDLGVLRVPHRQRTRVPVYFNSEVMPSTRSERCAEEDVERVVKDLERVCVGGGEGACRVGEGRACGKSSEH